jgi:ubiquinone/menaquinone biosynthesis C-methylase UbiE
VRPRLARALELAECRPGLHVVDVGCGRGETAVHLLRRGADVTAIDYSPGALALTRQTVDSVLQPGERKGLGLLAADAGRLPVRDGSADRVLLLDIVEHLHAWQLRRAFRETRRILAPDGYVVVHTLPNRWALEWAYPLLRLASLSLPAQPRSPYERAVHVNEQDPLSLSRALRQAGFASSVWVEEWTTAHATVGAGRTYYDSVRSSAYPLLRRQWLRRAIGAIMATPAGWIAGNDIFAIAWPRGEREPPALGHLKTSSRHALTRWPVRG